MATFLFEAACEYNKNIFKKCKIHTEIPHMIAKILSVFSALPLDPIGG